MEDEGIVDHALRLGNEVIGPRLEELKDTHPSVGDVRGLGAFWAIELVRDRETREPLAPYGQTPAVMGQIVAECKRNGMIPFLNMNRFHICPPLNTSEEDVLFGIDVLDQALSLADEALED